MSSNTLEAIFRQLEEVSSADADEDKHAPSIGLGLAVVSSIIKSLNGQIRVESKPGSGTSFSINVPLRLPLPSAPKSSGASLRPITSRESWEVDTLLSAITSSHMAPPENEPGKATPRPQAPDLGFGPSSRPTAPRSATSPFPLESGSNKKHCTSSQAAPLKLLVVDVSFRVEQQ
jgi:hypothetical protein